MLQGVHHEIGDDLSQPAVVAQHAHRPGLLQLDVAIGGEDPGVGYGVGRDLGQIDGLALERAALVEAGQ